MHAIAHVGLYRHRKRVCIGSSLAASMTRTLVISRTLYHDDDDVELNVLGCRVDILGTNCVCMVQCCFTSTETIRLIRTGSPGRPPRLSHSSLTLTLYQLSCPRVTWRKHPVSRAPGDGLAASVWRHNNHAVCNPRI